MYGNNDQSSSPTPQQRMWGIKTELITEPQDKLPFMVFVGHLLHTEAKDVTLKWVFDHVRNYIFCAAVMWGSVRSFAFPAPTYIDSIIHFAGGVTLIGSSIVLFALNFIHGVVELSKLKNFRALGVVTYLCLSLLASFELKTVFWGSP